MTAHSTAIVLDLIEGELQRIPEADREKVAQQVLGAIEGRFMLLPRPTEDETAEQIIADAGLPATLPRRIPS